MYARIESGRIAAIVLADAEFAATRGLVEVPDWAGVGDEWADGIVMRAGPSLTEARAAKDAELTAACAAAITSGVVLDVTGEELTYPTSPHDQANLNAVVTITLLGVPDGWTQELTTADAAGVWERRPHTAEQVRAVGLAVAAHVDACRARLAARRMALAAAEEIAGVAW